MLPLRLASPISENQLPTKTFYFLIFAQISSQCISYIRPDIITIYFLHSHRYSHNVFAHISLATKICRQTNKQREKHTLMEGPPAPQTTCSCYFTINMVPHLCIEQINKPRKKIIILLCKLQGLHLTRDLTSEYFAAMVCSYVLSNNV